MKYTLDENMMGNVTLILGVNPISLSYAFPFVLLQALVPRNRVVSTRGENIPL